MDGRVIRETRGSGGFGYDVLFEADERPGRTTAELDAADKDAISHRGREARADLTRRRWVRIECRSVPPCASPGPCGHSSGDD